MIDSIGRVLMRTVGAAARRVIGGADDVRLRREDDRMRRAAIRLAFLLGLLVLGTSAQPAAAERPGWFSNPAISGAPHVGATIFGAPGGIKCEPGCVGLVHEWTSCEGPGGAGADRPTGGLPFDGRPAPGCVARTRGELNYAVRPEDRGRHIQLHVIATNYDCGEVRTDGTQDCEYSSGHGYSATLGPISGAVAPSPTAPGALGPRNTAPPIVVGLPRPSAVLTASRGSWSGTQPLTFSYVWLRCSAAAGRCPPIAGATAASYRPTSRDIGARLTVLVVATNRAGSAWATSASTPPVSARAGAAGSVVDARALGPAERLVIAAVTPRVVRRLPRALRVTITDARGRRVRGALVEVSGAPRLVARAVGTSSASGVAVVRVRVRPSAPRGRVLVAITARKSPNDRFPSRRRVWLQVRP
jgi:hypothetical protein